MVLPAAPPLAVRPLSSRPAAALVFALCAPVYLAHMTPEVTFFDNAEYVACAHTLGINHSPGYPLFTVLAKSFATLVPGDVTSRVNVFNALVGATAAALFVPLALALGLRLPAATAGALAFGFSRSWWAYCGHAKVYTLNILLLEALFLALAAHRRAPSTARLGAAGALLGLLVGNHNSMVFSLPAVWLAARLATAAEGQRLRVVALTAAAIAAAILAIKLRGSAGSAAGALALGLAWIGRPGVAISRAHAAFCLAALGAYAIPYLAMMIRARQFPPMDFWSPTDLPRLLDTMRMKSYDYMTTATAFDQVLLQLRMYLHHLAHQWHPILAVLLPAAAAVLALRRRTATLAFAGVGFLVTSAGQFAVLNLSQYGPIMFAEVELWVIPSVFFASLLVAAGISEAAELAVGVRARILLAAVTALVPAGALVHNRFYADSSRNHIPADYARNILDSLPPHALLLTHFEDTFLLWHQQLVRGERTDVSVIVADLLAFDWYWKAHLPRRFPELTFPADSLPDAERGQESISVVQRLRERALLEANRARPRYTDNIELSRTGTSYLLVPEGTVWRIADDAGDLLAPPERAVRNLSAYAYRGVLDPTGTPLWLPDAPARSREVLRTHPASPPDRPDRWLAEGLRLYHLYENRPVVLDQRLDSYCQYVLNGYAREANFAGILLDAFGKRDAAARMWDLASRLNPLDANPTQNLEMLRSSPAATPPTPAALRRLLASHYTRMGLAHNARALAASMPSLP